MIYLKKELGRPLYKQLYEVFKNKISNGTLRKNQALPPIRAMAEELNISNNTVSHAYDLLLSEGYIRAVSGSGYYVEDIAKILDFSLLTRPPKPSRPTRPKKGASLKYDFKYESIDASLFPWTKWRQYMMDALSLESYKTSIGYEKNKGNEALRNSLCQYLNSTRGIECGPEQIVVGAGTQYCLDIITSLLKISKVAFEEPGYNAIRELFLNKGCKIIPIPLTNEGLNLKVLEALRDTKDLDILYITPSHQFPTGITTSMPERLALLKLADENNIYIIENDYDNEFAHGQKRLPALRSLNADNVIYLSTLSKVLSPSVRCAYFVLPHQLVTVYDDLYRHYNSALPSYNQMALSNFINDGHLNKHARKMSTLNKKKYEVFITTMRQLLDDRIEIIYKGPAGAHVLIRIRGCVNQMELIDQMRQRSIGIYSVKEHWHIKEPTPEDVFLLGYHSMSEITIVDGCRALAAAIKELVA